MSRIRASRMIYRDESRLMEDISCARLFDRRSVGVCQVTGARNLAFLVPTCSLSLILTGTRGIWRRSLACDCAITIYRCISPIVNPLLLDRSEVVQKESSPDPFLSFFLFILFTVRARETGYRFYSRDSMIYYWYPYWKMKKIWLQESHFFAWLDNIDEIQSFAIFSFISFFWSSFLCKLNRFKLFK